MNAYPVAGTGLSRIEIRRRMARQCTTVLLFGANAQGARSAAHTEQGKFV
jgi:hypothetical protein